MITALGTIGAFIGFAPKWQKLGGLAVSLVGIAGLGGIIWLIASHMMRAHDRAVVTLDRAQSTAQVLNEALAADRTAGAAKETRDRAQRDQHAKAMEAINAAQQDDDADPLSAGLDQLRK